MPLSIAPADGPLNRTRFSPDEERPGSRHPQTPHAPFAMIQAYGPQDFDSTAPVAVDADTELALTELQPVHEVPLPTVIAVYKDES